MLCQKIVKRDFYKYGNANISTEYTIWSSAFSIAIAYNVPFIIQGENEALTLGASQGLNRDGDAAQVYKNNTLSAVDAFERFGDVKDVSKKDLFMYRFPDSKRLDEVGIRAAYLEYYTNDWDQVKNAEFSMKHGMKIREDNLEELGAVQKFCALDSDMWIVNQLIKYVKFGFGYATDEACYEIREGRITREQGFELVRKYDGRCGDKYINKFCRYIDISIDEFWNVVEKFRNRDLFEKVNGEWKLKSDYR